MCDEAQTVEQAKPRRSVLRLLAGAAVALVTFPLGRARAKKVGLAVTKVAELQKVGGSKVLTIKDNKVLLIRDSEDSVKAINPVCTHKKCEVRYKADSNDLFCKCHKSAFKLDGTVVAGPAPRPLQTYEAALRNDQIVITLPD